MKTGSDRVKKPGAILINVVFAIWVLLSPFVLGFTQNPAAMLSNVAVGTALLGAAFVAGFGLHSALALNVPLGAWLFASPFVFGFGARWALLWNNVVMAFAVIIAAAAAEGLRQTSVSSRKVG